MKRLNLTLTLLAVLFSTLISSCSKEGDPAPQVTEPPVVTTPEVTPDPQNVMSAFLAENSHSITERNNGTYTLGYKFSSDKDGKITKIGVNMAAASTYKVSIWEFGSKDLLLETFVEQSYGAWSFKNTPELSIEANKEYVIAVYSKGEKYNVVSDLSFPIKVGDISINNVAWKSGDTFPGTKIQDEIYGLVDMEFVADM